MSLKFVPAMVGAIMHMNDKRFGENTLSWWEEKSIFHYDSVLISAFYGLKRPDFRDYYHIPRKGFKLIGDSGGFQISTKGIEMNIPELGEWYNNNVDMGITLDTPITNISFEKALESTYNDTEKLIKHTKVPLYGVLHGRTYDQVTQWWKKMSDFDFKWWSTGEKPPDNSMIQALALLKLKEEGVKNVHTLGVSGFAVVPVLSYLSKHFDTMTYDSGSYGIGAMYKTFYLPFGVGKNIFFGRDSPRISTLPCDCEVCRLCTAEDYYKEDSVSGALISLHNLLVHIRYNTFVSGLSENDELYKEFLLTNDVKERFMSEEGKFRTEVVFDFIDFSLENSLDEAYKKFTNRFGSLGNNPSDQLMFGNSKKLVQESIGAPDAPKAETTRVANVPKGQMTFL